MPDMNIFYLLGTFSGKTSDDEEHTEFKKYIQCVFRVVFMTVHMLILLSWHPKPHPPLSELVGKIASHQESYGSILNHLDLPYQIVFLYLKQTEVNNKTNLEDWIEFQKSGCQIPTKKPDENWLTSN